MATSEALGPKQEAADRILGRKALERGWITSEQLEGAIADQMRDLASGRPKIRPLGNILAARGYLSAERLVALLEEQNPPPVPGAPIPPSVHPPTLGKYALLRELGRGGMGVVYEAKDSVLERKVALKLLLTSPDTDPDEARIEVERFMREARLSANLSKHPHIVGVYEAGMAEGKCFLAMELIEGQPMSKWRQSEAVTLRDQVRLLRDVARAVHHAHLYGIIHRDLKPDNVLIDLKQQPHVTDFGLAKSLAPGAGASLTAAGRILGTPNYMSPEQAQGLEGLDRRTDVYALGVILFEALAGRPPFVADSLMKLLLKIAEEPVPSPSSLRPPWAPRPFDRELEEICLKALSKDPNRRHATAEEFADALERWLGKLGEALPPVPPPNSRPRRRRSARWILGGVTLGLLALGTAAMVKTGLLPREVRLARARLLLWEGKYEAAISLYDAILSREPSDRRAAAGRREAAEKRASPPDGGLPAETSSSKEIPRLPSTVKDPARSELKKPSPDSQRPVDEAFFREVAALSAADQVSSVVGKLRSLNPKWGGKPASKIENGKVTEFAIVPSSLVDISPIRALSELRILDLSGEWDRDSGRFKRGTLTDLSPLKGLPLTWLRIPGTSVKDLSPLKGMPLTLFRCDSTDVTDLSPLRGMHLTWLDVVNTPVSDLSPLEGMPLEFLACGTTPVSDLSPLKKMPLKRLHFPRTLVKDLEPIRTLPHLQEIRFESVFVAERDAAILRSMKNLVEINGIPAAEFIEKYARPWQPIFSGRSIETLILDPDKGWSFDPKGVLTSQGGVCTLRTRQDFENGEFRIRFEVTGQLRLLSASVRHSAERGYTLIPDPDQMAVPKGMVHEILFICHGEQVSGKLDGKTVTLKNRNGPPAGPLQIHVMGSGRVLIHSLERRPE